MAEGLKLKAEEVEAVVTIGHEGQITIRAYAARWNLPFNKITQAAFLKGVQVLEAEMEPANSLPESGYGGV